MALASSSFAWLAFWNEPGVKHPSAWGLALLGFLRKQVCCSDRGEVAEQFAQRLGAGAPHFGFQYLFDFVGRHAALDHFYLERGFHFIELSLAVMGRHDGGNAHGNAAENGEQPDDDAAKAQEFAAVKFGEQVLHGGVLDNSGCPLGRETGSWVNSFQYHRSWRNCKKNEEVTIVGRVYMTSPC